MWWETENKYKKILCLTVLNFKMQLQATMVLDCEHSHILLRCSKESTKWKYIQWTEVIWGELLWIQSKLHTFMWLLQRNHLNPWDELCVWHVTLTYVSAWRCIRINTESINTVCVRSCVTFCAAQFSFESLAQRKCVKYFCMR